MSSTSTSSPPNPIVSYTMDGQHIKTLKDDLINDNKEFRVVLNVLGNSPEPFTAEFHDVFIIPNNEEFQGLLLQNLKEFFQRCLSEFLVNGDNLFHQLTTDSVEYYYECS